MSGTQRAPRVPFAVLVTVLLVGGLGLLLALNTASAANELHRHNLASTDQRIAAQVQQLRNEVASSAAPGNLARAAAELGMVPAANPAFIVLGANGSVQVMGKPKPVIGVPQAIAPAPATKPHAATTPTPGKTPTSAKTPATSSKTPASTKTRATSSKTPSSARATNKTSRTSGPAGGAHGKSKKPTAPKAPTATPTPTPTLTLPGGNR